MKHNICKKSLLIAALSAAIAGLGSLPASATINPALSMTSQGGSSNLGGYNMGWEFTTTRDLIVTHLGMWDQGNNGNTLDHPIGIWRSSDTALMGSGTLLATDPIISSGGGGAQNTFLYKDIPDFYLPQGTYRIAGAVGGNVPGGGSSTVDGWTLNPIGLAAASGIIVGHGYDSNLDGENLSFPFRDDGANPALGANFMFDEVPEPSTILLIACGGLLLYRRAQSPSPSQSSLQGVRAADDRA